MPGTGGGTFAGGLSVALGIGRFAVGLRAFARTPVSPAEARAIVEARLRDRQGRFLRMLERAVYGNPRSPYLPLLRAAGCEWGDLAALVRADGVEGALARLRDSGVYVTFEEFKGREAAVRGRQRFALREQDFNNPLITPRYVTTSSGTGGRATRILIDVDYLADRAPHWALWLADHRLLHHRMAFVTPRYPAIVNRLLICAKIGVRPVHWYATGSDGRVAYRIATTLIHALARRMAGLPRPTRAPLDGVTTSRIARSIARLAQEGPGACVVTACSTAVRLSAAAGAGGLAGVTFLAGGEPLTAARRATVETSGARVIPTYGTSEVGTIGSQCSDPLAPDEVHVSGDAFAVLQRPRALPDGIRAGATLLTTLLPTTPKVLLNVEIGDYGTLESRPCACAFGQLGLDQRLHTIRSFVKLTGEGVTFTGPDLEWVIEHVLPTRFGGTPVDYQIIELQDGRGRPQYQLRISPEVGPVEAAAAVATVLQELRKLRPAYRFMAEQWAQAGSLRVTRKRPLLSPSGKTLPFRTLTSR
jgi:hypothetical protein